MGGLLDATTPTAELQALLLEDADSYTWVAAAVGAQTAAGYQLSTGYPVMSLGGFNGSDPWPTLAVFQEYVASGQVHWFIGGGGFGGQNGGASTTSEISAWVTENFTADRRRGHGATSPHPCRAGPAPLRDALLTESDGLRVHRRFAWCARGSGRSASVAHSG
jgi:hypothetical protein